MKSSFQLASELAFMTINTVKSVKLQNSILSNLKMLFDQKKKDVLPPSYPMTLKELGMLNEWHYETGQIISRNIREAVLEAMSAGMTNKQIGEELGISPRKVPSLIK
jgi:DNA-binding NarL/FixJ family response regulator